MTTSRMCLLQMNECNQSVELKSLRVPVGKYCIQWAFLPTCKLCRLRALWVPVAFVPNLVWLFSRNMPSMAFVGLQLSIRLVNQSAIRGLKTYILWWSRRHKTEAPLTLLHPNLNYVMECGVTNPFSTIELSIEGGLCQVNILKEGTPGSIGLNWSVL